MTGAVLDRILGEGIESQEMFGELDGADLLPAEAAVVAGAVASRRREYAAVRICARACLRRLGYPDVPLLPGVDGAPTWPAGATGSMTHCPGYAAAAVGRTARVAAIGIDAEPDEPLPDGVIEVVATTGDLARLAESPSGPGRPCWDRLMFSAKETVFKAWWPLFGEWLEGDQIEIAIGPEHRSFTAVVAPNGTSGGNHRVSRLRGHWARGRGIVVTALVLPRTRNQMCA